MREPETEVVECDVLIIGGGMAGTGAAFEAAYWAKEKGLRVVIVEKAAIEKSKRTIASMPPADNTWYLGRWGLQFYGEQAGMKPVLPDESVFQPGDWLVTTDSVYAPEPVLAHLRRYHLVPVAEFALEDAFPLSTMLGYYNTGIPIHHQQGPRRRVKIYRIEGLAG